MSTFGERLAEALASRGPLCIGIDPHPQLLTAWGLGVDTDGLEKFSELCVEAFDGVVAVVKPQVAFFEVFGSAGLEVLERTVAVLRGSGTLVLADAKRGDIGSTMDAYARTWLADESPLCSDAVTVSPYLGFGALAPALDLGARTGRGVFVLAATSNPEGGQVQNARLEDGRTVAQAMVDEAAARNAGADRLGSVGVVVGATLAQAPDLRELNGPVLMPGVGAQGGTADDVRRLAAGNLKAVVPNVSREVLRAGPSVPALRDAVARTVEQFAFLQD
ncbi:orotidine-5'-phosphate decarboxylase [Rhodococcus coprophilus]|uniref:Orotidine 5'-phosphate decarboxylase n=1 Tax=Rhodococcus coprophilus TaxID=38310 RepID=A0A2X4U1G1_9NOCA|nr:orotidine-5'-phosphate decarboxylase [Rhodococcus coprophilus]MBM7461096.1 orotidine-5'-phosphate decarboxylase [Rhodococcus coprophilus]SQI28898.1 orotidine-5'-phosphate decarboxylase pyrf [Rhodococcus coprophilus]